MESLVERLFRETYELHEIPDPRGGSPYPMRPSELLPLSSPLVKTVSEGGDDPEWPDHDVYAWLQYTSHVYFSGLLEDVGPSPSLHDSDPDTSQALQVSADPGSDNPDGGTRRVTSKYSH